MWRFASACPCGPEFVEIDSVEDRIDSARGGMLVKGTYGSPDVLERQRDVRIPENGERLGSDDGRVKRGDDAGGATEVDKPPPRGQGSFRRFARPR